MAAGVHGAHGTHIPVLCPLRQIWVVHPPVAAYMLTWSDEHVLIRLDIHHGRFSRIGVGHPYCYRKAVRRTAERDRERSAKIEEQIGSPILVCCASLSRCASSWTCGPFCAQAGLRTVDVGADRERRVVGESFSRVVICAVDVRVVLAQCKYLLSRA